MFSPGFAGVFFIIFYYEKWVFNKLPRCLMGIVDLTFHFSNFLFGADSLLHSFLFYVEDSVSLKYLWILAPAELILYPDCLLSEAPAFTLNLIFCPCYQSCTAFQSRVFYFHLMWLHVYSYYITRLTEKTRAFKVCLKWNFTNSPTRMNWILQTFKIATCPCCSFSHTHN